MKNITRETINNNLLWAVELETPYGRHWVTGTHDEIAWAFDSDEFSDCDLCADQPECIRPFLDAYWAYDREHGFTTIPEFMDIYFKEVA